MQLRICARSVSIESDHSVYIEIKAEGVTDISLDPTELLHFLDHNQIRNIIQALDPTEICRVTNLVDPSDLPDPFDPR